METLLYIIKIKKFPYISPSQPQKVINTTNTLHIAIKKFESVTNESHVNHEQPWGRQKHIMHIQSVHQVIPIHVYSNQKNNPQFQCMQSLIFDRINIEKQLLIMFYEYTDVYALFEN